MLFCVSALSQSQTAKRNTMTSSPTCVQLANADNTFPVDQEKWFPYVRCLEASTELDVEKRAAHCAKTANIAWKKIQACATGVSLPADAVENAPRVDLSDSVTHSAGRGRASVRDCSCALDQYSPDEHARDDCSRIVILTPRKVQLLRSTCTSRGGCLCSAGDLGVELEVEAATATAVLDPPHVYVPWVTVNDVAIGQGYQFLLTFVCAAYTGNRCDTRPCCR